MCGRFAFYSPAEAVRDYFGVEWSGREPRYNIAPTQDVPVLRLKPDGSRELAELRWGLVPSWARDPAVGNRMINARAETVAEKPAFRAAWRRRRCAVLADGFYEWQAVSGGPKQPWFIRPASKGPFAMAGLWEHWERGEEPLYTCTILTMAASRAMREIHHRMPVILDGDGLEQWLAPDGDAAGVLDRAGPELQMHPVSRAVNSPAHEGPDLIRPAD